MWFGVVWCGLVWFGVVWCGLVWFGVVWCGLVWLLGRFVGLAFWLRKETHRKPATWKPAGANKSQSRRCRLLFDPCFSNPPVRSNPIRPHLTPFDPVANNQLLLQRETKETSERISGKVTSSSLLGSPYMSFLGGFLSRRSAKHRSEPKPRKSQCWGDEGVPLASRGKPPQPLDIYGDPTWNKTAKTQGNTHQNPKKKKKEKEKTYSCCLSFF